MQRSERDRRAARIKADDALTVQMLCDAIGPSLVASNIDHQRLLHEIELATLAMTLDADLGSKPLKKKRHAYIQQLKTQTEALLTLLRSEHAPWFFTGGAFVTEADTVKIFSVADQLRAVNTSRQKIADDLIQLLAVTKSAQTLADDKDRPEALALPSKMLLSGHNTPFENLIISLQRIYREHICCDVTFGTDAPSPFERFAQAVLNNWRIVKSNGKPYAWKSFRKAVEKDPDRQVRGKLKK